MPSSLLHHAARRWAARRWAPLLAAACAPTTAATPVSTTVALPQTGAQNDVRLSANAPADLRIAVPIARVWSVLPAAYDALKLPVNVLQPAAFTVGANEANFVRKLGDEQLSRFLTCGTRGFGTDIADEGGGVVLTVMTTATAAGDSSTVIRTVVTGTARVQGGAANVARCNTTGRLESRLLDDLRQRLGIAR
jgi:hypothetical protein